MKARVNAATFRIHVHLHFALSDARQTTSKSLLPGTIHHSFSPTTCARINSSHVLSGSAFTCNFLLYYPLGISYEYLKWKWMRDLIRAR